MLAAFIALTISTDLPLGLRAGDLVYRCTSELVMPPFSRFDPVYIAMDGDVWTFSPELAKQTGIAGAQVELTTAGWQILMPVPGHAERTFSALAVGSDEDENHMAMTWNVRGPVAGPDSEALLTSGVTICDLRPIEAQQDNAE